MKGVPMTKLLEDPQPIFIGWLTFAGGFIALAGVIVGRRLTP